MRKIKIEFHRRLKISVHYPQHPAMTVCKSKALVQCCYQFYTVSLYVIGQSWKA